MSLHPEGAVLVPLLSTAALTLDSKRSILCPSLASGRDAVLWLAFGEGVAAQPFP